MTVLRYSNLKLRSRIVSGEEPAWLQRHPRRAYIVRCVLATPPWVNLAELRRLEKRARELTALTGRKHVVDHEIPLNNRWVCGLNVQGNLRVVLERVNQLKLNHWTERHGELFAEPEQFSMRFV